MKNFIFPKISLQPVSQNWNPSPLKLIYLMGNDEDENVGVGSGVHDVGNGDDVL
jgi:hypothetical protein